MSDLFASVDSQTVLLVAAIAVSLLLLQLLSRVLSVGWKLILPLVGIVFALQYFWGISPDQLWVEISHLPQELLRLVQNLQLPEFGMLRTF
jgi:hypothetical protein